MAAIAAFLRRYPPFDALPDGELERAEAAVRERTYAAGDLVLIEDGTPARHLYVVRTGSVELVHEEEVIDVLEPGEAFGHPSLLSGMAPAFDVRAREPTVCLLLDAALALRLLGSPSGVEFVASSLRERLVRTGHVAHAQADQRTAHLGALVHRPAVECPPETTAGNAARLMAEADVSCLLVRLPDGFGIVTDSDLRRKLIARDRSYDTPVRELMVAPALTFRPERLAVDAMIDMLDAGIHHLPIVEANGVAVGVVTATDLMYLESRTPFALRRSIAHAATADEVVEAASHLPQVVVSLTRAGVVATDIGRVLALQSDTATVRLIDLALARHGTAPSAWAWMALGSTARREASLASDQDNALAYAGEDGDDWYAALAADVNDGLARCGFGADNADVLARNRQWRMSEADWQRVFRDCLEQPDRSHLVRAASRSTSGMFAAASRSCGRWSRSSARRRHTPTSCAGWPAPRPTSSLRSASAGGSRSTTTAASTSSAAAWCRSPTWPASMPSRPGSPSRTRSGGCARRHRPGRSRGSGRRLLRRRSSSSPACAWSTRRPRSRRARRRPTGSLPPTWRRSPGASCAAPCASSPTHSTRSPGSSRWACSSGHVCARTLYSSRST